MTTRLPPRAFLAAASACTNAAGRSRAAEAPRLVLLGTGGGPRPRKESSGSAQVIVAASRREPA